MSLFPTPARRRRLAAVAAVAAVATALGGLVSPAATAAQPGQSQTISGVVVNPAGAGVAGVDVSYDNVTCATRTPIGSDSSTVISGADGTFTFPTYPGHCYTLDVDGDLFTYQGRTSAAAVVASGSANVRLTTDVATKPVTVKVPGAPDGTQVLLLAAIDYLGVKAWYPVDGDTLSGGAVTLSVAPGLVYTTYVERNGDHYDQFPGGATTAPSFTGGTGTFTSSSATVSVTLRKSVPVQVTLNGFDPGAEVTAVPLNSVFGSPGSGSVTETATGAVATLHGLQPVPQLVSADGTHGTDTVSGDVVGVTPKTSGTTAVSITGSVRSDALLDNVLSSVSVSDPALKVGSTLTQSVTLDEEAAPLLGRPTTTIRYYWVAYDTFTDGFGFGRVVGTGKTLTIDASLLGTPLLVAIAVVSAPGYVSDTGLGFGFVDPSLLGGSLPYNLGVVTSGDAPLPTVTPSVSGAARVGMTLTAHPGTWTPRPTGVRYQWRADGAAIPGATGQTFRPTAALVRKRISVTVTPILAGHRIVAYTSPQTARLAPADSHLRLTGGKKHRVTVRLRATAPPSGRLVIKVDGKRRKAVAVSPHGRLAVKITVKIKKVKRGKHPVTVRYSGNDAVVGTVLTRPLRFR